MGKTVYQFTLLFKKMKVQFDRIVSHFLGKVWDESCHFINLSIFISTWVKVWIHRHYLINQEESLGGNFPNFKISGGVRV